MTPFTPLDLAALAVFLLAWTSYAIALEWTARGRTSLNSRMNHYRDVWMDRMLERDVRIVDTQIMASLQNGTAFFASTSLIAIGGALTVLRSTNDILGVVNALPGSFETSRALWEIKAIGLAGIFAYAFFKFAWSYRLFNYVAILLGAMPSHKEKDTPEARAYAARSARLCAVAGLHFNRGQRAFFFAIGYLGWFLSPWLLMITTAGVVAVLLRRQFGTSSLQALEPERFRTDAAGSPAGTRRSSRS
jgi:uncharacterized membrane protein